MNFQPKFDSSRSSDGKIRPQTAESSQERASAPRLTLVPPAEPAAAGSPAADPPKPASDERKNRSLITRLSLIGFVTALASRATDPIIPPIAHDIGVDPNAVALLATA